MQWRTCMRICYVHYSCQPTSQPQKTVITIQNCEWLHVRKTELVLLCQRLYGRSCCHDWTAFRLRLNVSLRTVSIHREMLASRKLSPKLNSVLNDVIKVIYHIKKHALNLRLFEQLCEEMDAEHKRLLLYTEVRWLSKGRSLARVFELWELLQRFLSEKKSPLAHFSDKEWVAKLAYLCDIFNLLNELNLTTVFKLADKVAAFKANLELWGWRVNRGTFDMFQTLAGILLVHDHLSLLLKEFERYFPTTNDPRNAKEWICDPFVNMPGVLSMSVLEEDQLLTVTLKFESTSKSASVLD